MTEAKDRSPSYGGYAVTRLFVQIALSEQADLSPPTCRETRRWNRDLAILQRYTLTDATLQDIGNDSYLTRERVRQVVSDTMRQLWLRCPPSIQDLFPLSELPTPIPFYQQLTSQLTDPLRSDLDIQQTLAQIPPHFYKMDRHRPPPLLTTINELLKKLGFHYWAGRQGGMQRFVDVLTEAGIPVGEMVRMVKHGPQQGLQRYRFIATIHQERAWQMLENNPALDSFRHYSVRQVTGPDYPAPSVYRLQKRQGFVPCGPIFAELGIGAAGQSKIRQRDFWTGDCPVSVFYNKRSYYCPADQAEALRRFIQQQLSSLP